MSRRLVLLTEIISPYRIPLFNALARRSGVDLHVIFLSETDPSLRQWQVYKDEIRFSHEVLPSVRKRIAGFNMLLNRGVARALDRASPDVILCGGYSYVASWRTMFWANSRGVPLILWSESNAQDSRRGHTAVEFLKGAFLKRCDRFVVPGRSARQYLASRGVREDFVYTAPNAVDNDLFVKAAELACNDALALRERLKLPARYFLFVGRLVAEKGVFELLSAYAKLDEPLHRQIGLVLVGDGPAKPVLQGLAAKIASGHVIFPGFAHREQLPTYYALAEMLILPTYTDTWGLVVNEGMACGLPVILSRAAGCSDDLVEENWNGVLIPPKNESALVAAMERLATQNDVRLRMAANSRQRIARYSPEGWADGIVQAVGNTLGGHRA
jgi:glycosyltransferase involved in cell wall biosynthesis